MNDRIRRVFEMTLRAYNFMRANLADFQDIPFVAPTVAALQTETDTLARLAADKVSDTAFAKDTTIFRGDSRDTLRDDLEYIAEVWRSIPDKTGGATNKFRMASGNNDQNLIAIGRAFVADAADAETQAILTEQGITSAFIAAVQSETDAFEQAVGAANTATGERVGTNAAFDDPARRAKALVVKLSPAVKRRYRDDPKKLAEWLVASRIEQPPAPKTPAAPAGNPPTV